MSRIQGIPKERATPFARMLYNMTQKRNSWR